MLLAGSGCFFLRGVDNGNVVVGGDNIVAKTNQTIPGHPHTIDLFHTSNAQPKYAIIFLHGGGGTKEKFAQALGIDEPFLSRFDLLAVFPQGQTKMGGNRTWSNYVMDSGQNDVAFLTDLSAFVRSRYKVKKVYVVGHSNGGMMANRLWCEAPEPFDGFGSFAGPASVALGPDGKAPCNPKVKRPYVGVVGDRDRVLQTSGSFDQPVWSVRPLLVTDAFTDPKLVNEVRFHTEVRAPLMCGERPAAQPTQKRGKTSVWSACNGKLELIRVSGGGHPIDDLIQAAGVDLKTQVITELERG